MKKKKKKILKKFRKHLEKVYGLVEKHIGSDNYAGSYSLGQLDRIDDKFFDCMEN